MFDCTAPFLIDVLPIHSDNYTFFQFRAKYSCRSQLIAVIWVLIIRNQIQISWILREVNQALFLSGPAN